MTRVLCKHLRAGEKEIRRDKSKDDKSLQSLRCYMTMMIWLIMLQHHLCNCDDDDDDDGVPNDVSLFLSLYLCTCVQQCKQNE